MPPSDPIREPDRRAAMFRIVGAWLVVALLALAWSGPGVALVPAADGEAVLFAAIDPAQGGAPDGPEPSPDAQCGGDGEAEPDAGASCAATPWHPASCASRLSAVTAIAPPRRAFASYRSQAPPLA